MTGDTPMDPAGRIEVFDGTEMRISDLESEIAKARAGIGAHAGNGWWTWGAGKWLDKLKQARRAQRLGEYRFIVHQPEGRATYGLCARGALISGELDKDLTLAEFADMPGHLPWPEEGSSDHETRSSAPYD